MTAQPNTQTAPTATMTHVAGRNFAAPQSATPMTAMVQGPAVPAPWALHVAQVCANKLRRTADTQDDQQGHLLRRIKPAHFYGARKRLAEIIDRFGPGSPEASTAAEIAEKRAPTVRDLLFSNVEDDPVSSYEKQLQENPERHLALTDMASPQYKAFCLRTFVEAWNREELTLDDTQPWRVRACWRLVREMARLKNQCGHDEPLMSALCPDDSDQAGQPDPWSAPYDNFMPLGNGANQTFAAVLKEASELLPEDQAWFFLNASDSSSLRIKPGIPLLPPPAPLCFYENGRISERYDPYQDRGLMLYIRALRAVATSLGVLHGTTRDPEAGEKGLLGVLNPVLVRIAFPNRSQMLAWEYALITDIVRKLVRNGNVRTIQYIETNFGLTQHETAGLMRMARAMARKMTEGDMEEQKGIMLLRLENYLNKAHANLDLKAELNGLKQMALVSGLTKMDSDETMKDFLTVVKTVSAAASAKAIVLKPVAQLPMPM